MSVETPFPRPPTAGTGPTRTDRCEATIDVAGRRVSLSLPVPSGRLTLAQLVAPARAICDSLVRAFRQAAQDNGEPVPCRKGCSACCRYLVPLSVPEALLLPAEVAALPAAAGRQTHRALLAAANRILRAGRPDIADDADTLAAARAVGEWYAGLQMDCPLLAASCCRLYEHRPLACREHLARQSPARCAVLDPGLGTVLDRGPSVSTALSQLAGELEGRDGEAIMLPLALPWHEDNRDRGLATYPAGAAIQRLVQLLEAQADSEAAAA